MKHTHEVFVVYNNKNKEKELGRFWLIRDIDNDSTTNIQATILEGSHFFHKTLNYGKTCDKIELEKWRWSFLDHVNNDYKFMHNIVVSGRDEAMHLIAGGNAWTKTFTEDDEPIKIWCSKNMSNGKKI